MPYNVSGIRLEGQDTGTVPIFDTCDDVRRKIRNFLNRLSCERSPAAVPDLKKTKPRP